jgi:uncharacterized protein (DUF302 family)
MFSYHIEVNLSVEETVQSIERHLKDKKFQLLWKYDVPTKLLEQGIRLDQPYWILEFSHPELTKKMLMSDKMSGLFLPCKIVIYREKATEKTIVAMLKPTLLHSYMEATDLNEIVKQLEEKMVQVLNEVERQIIL